MFGIELKEFLELIKREKSKDRKFDIEIAKQRGIGKDKFVRPYLRLRRDGALPSNRTTMGNLTAHGSIDYVDPLAVGTDYSMMVKKYITLDDLLKADKASDRTIDVYVDGVIGNKIRVWDGTAEAVIEVKSDIYLTFGGRFMLLNVSKKNGIYTLHKVHNNDRATINGKRSPRPITKVVNGKYHTFK